MIPTNVPPSITIKPSREHNHDDSREEQNAKKRSSLTPHKSYSCASIHPSLGTINYIMPSLQTSDWLKVGPQWLWHNLLSSSITQVPWSLGWPELPKSETPFNGQRATGEWLMRSLIVGHTRKTYFSVCTRRSVKPAIANWSVYVYTFSRFPGGHDRMMKNLSIDRN